MDAKDLGFLGAASNSAVEIILETVLYMKWCEQQGVMYDWQLAVMPLIFHLGRTGEKTLPSNWRMFSVIQSKAFMLFVRPFFVHLFLRMEFLRMELQSSVVHLFKKLSHILSKQALEAAVGLSQSFVWQSAPWPLLRDANCCSGSLQGVARCQLSSFRPWQQMLSISESLRLVCFLHNIIKICLLNFCDLDIQNEFFNREILFF